MSINNIARQGVVTAATDTPVRDIARTMDREGANCVVVVNEATPVGTLTDRQIALAVGEHDDPGSLAAADLMRGDLVTVSAGDDVFEVVEVMAAEGVRRMPVVDEQGNVEGVVALDDVLGFLGREVAAASDLVRERSPGG